MEQWKTRLGKGGEDSVGWMDFEARVRYLGRHIPGDGAGCEVDARSTNLSGSGMHSVAFRLIGPANISM